MSRKVKVCVIGAGGAGLCAARHLSRLPQLYQVDVFEQTDSVGGTWVYTPETGISKNGLPIHQSMYKNLRTNLPKEIMPFLDFQFDPHLPSFIPHADMNNYLQHYADHFNVMPLIHFNMVVTNVTSNSTDYTPLSVGDTQFSVEPRGTTENGFCFHQWKVTTQNVLTKATTTAVYDAVMVCNGHYSIPWKCDVADVENFPPDKIIHSHSYRDPASYRGQTVLVIGAGSSGKDIILDVATEAKQVVLSNKKNPVKCPLPDNVKQFVEIEKVQQDGVVLFKDGKVLSPDCIIMCNGYDFSFPFLDETCDLTVDERQIYPLHKHVFNARRPSMAFIGINITVLPFPYFDLQSRWVLSVWSRLAKLPSTDGMIKECDAFYLKQKSKGVPKKYTHQLAANQWDYYYDVATCGGNSPLNYVIHRMYDTVYDYRAADLIGYKNYQFTITGHSTFLDPKTAEDVEPKPKIKIAVIGAGISGLCAVRHCCKFLDRVSVTVFEEGTQIKSWWNFPEVNGGKLSGEYLRTNLPADLTGFQDFAFPPNTDTFPTQSQILKYLQDYSDHYNLLQHVKFNHRVDHVSLKEGGAVCKWSVKVTDLINNQTLCEEFDNVFVCSDLSEKFVSPPEDYERTQYLTQHDVQLNPPKAEIYAGYESAFPFLDDSCGFTVDIKRGIQPLFLHTFNAHHPSMAFLGTLTNISFAYCDMQVMWALRVWLGLQQPPLQSTTEMLEECKDNVPGVRSHLDFVTIYKKLSDYCKAQPATPAFSAIIQFLGKDWKLGSQYQSKHMINVLSSEYWILNKAQQ